METNNIYPNVYHTPALLKESIDGLDIIPSGVYVDVTFGGGGHSREILKRLGEKGRLFAFDQDKDAIKNEIQDPRFTLIYGNFRFLKNFLKYYNIYSIDGLIADLGVSSHHFDESDRGFSFRYNGDLDMRMNQRAKTSAADILNEYSAEMLSDIFYKYGELKEARKIASAIVKFRELKKIEKIEELLSIVEPFTRKDREKKILAQTFQALRIEVNKEIDTLAVMLKQALQILKPEGRLSVISYHSLEDRLVKNFFKSGNFEGNIEKDFYGNPLTPFKLINRKVIIPTKEEQVQNPRSRSAKLRIAEKIAES